MGVMGCIFFAPVHEPMRLQVIITVRSSNPPVVPLENVNKSPHQHQRPRFYFILCNRTENGLKPLPFNRGGVLISLRTRGADQRPLAARTSSAPSVWEGWCQGRRWRLSPDLSHVPRACFYGDMSQMKIIDKTNVLTGRASGTFHVFPHSRSFKSDIIRRGHGSRAARLHLHVAFFSPCQLLGYKCPAVF